MKRAQKNFERDPSKKNFHVSETLRDAKAKNHEQSSWFNKKNRAKKKKKSGNLMKRAQKKFERDPRKEIFCERNPRLSESKKLRTKFAI